MTTSISTTTTDGEPPMVAPDLLTLAEAAAVLRIGRTVIYELARRHEDSRGVDDELVVVRIGRQYRVPKAWLEARVGGPLTWPPSIPSRPASRPPAIAQAATAPRSRSRRSRGGGASSPTFFSV
jgi:excisionase family DNA binding protein